MFAKIQALSISIEAHYAIQSALIHRINEIKIDVLTSERDSCDTAWFRIIGIRIIVTITTKPPRQNKRVSANFLFSLLVNL